MRSPVRHLSLLISSLAIVLALGFAPSARAAVPIQVPTPTCTGAEESFAAGGTRMDLTGGRCDGIADILPGEHWVTHCSIGYVQRPDPAVIHLVTHASAPNPNGGGAVNLSLRAMDPIPAAEVVITITCDWQSDMNRETDPAEMTFRYHIVDAPGTCVDATTTTSVATSVTVLPECSSVWARRSVAKQPANGTLAGPDASGRYTYAPAAGFSGPDSFQLRSSNAKGDTVATYTFVVSAPAPPPPPAPPATLALRAAPVLRMRSRDAMVQCRASAPMRACVVTARVGTRIVGGFKLTTNWDRPAVPMRLNALGQRLAANTPGGIVVTLAGRATFESGSATARTITRRIVPERQRVVPPMVVLFDANRAGLSARGVRFFRGVAASLTAAGAKRVACEGFVSTTGLDGNPGLAEERAEVVCELLRARGVRAKLTTISRNTDAPRTSNATEASRRYNRRVELVVRY